MGLFWGCFIALITTSFAFVTRAFLVNDPALWPAEFGLDKVQAQELFGAGVWPFAISIILFSLVIDRIGYRTAMVFSFLCYAAYAALALSAYGVIHSGRRRPDRRGARRRAHQGVRPALLGFRHPRPGQRHRGGLHQPGRRHDVQQGQDQVAEHPPRRLARRPGARRHDHDRARLPCDRRLARVALCARDPGAGLPRDAEQGAVPRERARGRGHLLP